MRQPPSKNLARTDRLVAVVLPEEVVNWLASIAPDPGGAIVRLFQRQNRRQKRRDQASSDDVELVSIGPDRALILARQTALRELQDLRPIDVGGGRAVLALDDEKGVADLELAVIDRLEEHGLSKTGRQKLARLREHLRAWRRDEALTCTTRSILILERVSTSVPRRARPRGSL